MGTFLHQAWRAVQVREVECDSHDAVASIAQLLEAENVRAVIGPFCSLSCESSAYFTSKLNIPQISYSDTPHPPTHRQ